MTLGNHRGQSSGEIDLTRLIAPEELQGIQDVLGEAMNAAAVVVDPGGHALTKPAGFVKVCRMIRGVERGKSDCKAFHNRLARDAISRREPVHAYCPRTGFLDGCVPVFLDDRLLATVYVGQAAPAEQSVGDIDGFCSELGLDRSAVEAAMAAMLPTDEHRFAGGLELAHLMFHRILNERHRSRRLEAERDALEREHTEFAYIVSHDLKAPLRAVEQLVTWIAEDAAEKMEEDDREMVDLLKSRLDRMNNLMEGVLQYSRVSRIREEPADVNLSVVLGGLSDKYAENNGVAITIGPNFPIVYAEPKRIETVFAQLLDNAVRFMDKPDGRIAVDWHDDGDRWTFRVEDNGPGIDPAKHDKIFTMFYTLSSRDEFESTGVGLTLAKKIVQAAGGEIWVTSEPGTGSVFSFTLPKGEKPK